MPTTTSYDLPSSLYTIEFDYGDFVVNPTCNTTVSAKFLGYTPFLGAQSFRVVMDSRSFADAVGINNGYLSIVSLAEVKDVDGASINFTYRGYTYAGNYYVDPYYVGMRPLYCIRNLDSEAEINSDPPLPLLTADGNGVHQLCFMAVGSGLLAIPAMVHYGAAPLTPKPCFWYVKDSLAILLIGSFSSDMYGHEEACSEFNIVSTLIFYNVRTSNSLQIQAQDIAQQLILLLETVLRNNGYRTLTRNVYNASFASAASAYKPFTDSIVDDDQWREDAYSFCFKNCSVLTINSFGKTITDKALTEYMYQFNDGSCSDVYGLTVQGAVNLIRNPPTDFVERYYECAMAPQDALNDAIGIASGNATTLVPIAFMVLLPFLYIWLDITGHSKMKDEFTEEDREDMQNRLVTQLLRVRDGKVRAIPEASPVFQLSTELERLKTVQGGYPDSDDSDDEPEPLPGTSKPNHLPRASTSASTQSVVAVPYDNYLQAKL